MPLPKTGAIEYHTQLGLADKINQRVGCLRWLGSKRFGSAERFCIKL